MSPQKPIQLSPNSLNLFFECPLCFWLEKKKGIKRPQPFPYALNIAVDYLLKEEFDEYRLKGERHPLLVAINIDAKLFNDQGLLNAWRDNFRGIRHYDAKLDATLFGVVDDILEFPGDKLAPLDYKTTGSSIPSVYDRFQLQLDVYTYLLEKNGYETVRKGCLAFYIVDKKSGFKDKLPFRKEVHIIDTDPSYIPEVFEQAVRLLRSDTPPLHATECRYGQWLERAVGYQNN